MSRTSLPVARRPRLRLAVALAALSLASVACGGGDDGGSASDAASPGASADGGDKPDVGLVYDLGGRGDRSFNDAAARGLDRAAEELGVGKKELEPNASGDNREELLRLLADQGAAPILGIGFLFGDAIKAVATEYPDSTFAIVDSVVDAPNVKSLVFAEEQGSFLVGAAAALKSTTGKLGFIGGVETDLIKKFEAGFVAGAQRVRPDVTVDVKYITQPPDFSGFADPAKGKEIARAQYAAGADVIYAAAGGSGNGVFEAAKEGSTGGTKLWTVGVDSDQYELVDDALKPFILTSMLKKVDVAVYEAIKEYDEGNAAGGTQVFDLAADGVGYSTSGGFVDDITGQLEELKQQIIDGTITVPTAP